jgi:hypothetical protein
MIIKQIHDPSFYLINQWYANFSFWCDVADRGYPELFRRYHHHTLVVLLALVCSRLLGEHIQWAIFFAWDVLDFIIVFL